MSFGHEGPLRIEIEAALKRYNLDIPTSGDIVGLGGESVPYKRIMKIAKEALRS
ncbi:hypothetical protein ES705_39679 [subsurface metagenome]